MFAIISLSIAIALLTCFGVGKLACYIYPPLPAFLDIQNCTIIGIIISPAIICKANRRFSF